MNNKFSSGNPNIPFYVHCAHNSHWSLIRLAFSITQSSENKRFATWHIGASESECKYNRFLFLAL